MLNKKKNLPTFSNSSMYITKSLWQFMFISGRQSNSNFFFLGGGGLNTFADIACKPKNICFARLSCRPSRSTRRGHSMWLLALSAAQNKVLIARVLNTEWSSN